VSIGQVILGVRDLDGATVRVESLGLTVIDGGVHPGLGTANRIVPLGDSYLELLGVVDEAEAGASPYGRALLENTADGDRLVRWSIRTDGIDDVCVRLGLTAERRQRRRPDGAMLTWRAAGLDLALQDGWLPFFMQWDDPTQFPGAIPVQHPRGRCRLARLELTPADAEQLQRWTADDADLPTCTTAGSPGLHAVAIATDDGELVIRP
jgi:hypothetical protein